MPYKIYKDPQGNYRDVPTHKVEKFLSKYPNSTEATTEEYENIRAKQPKTSELSSREANIQNGNVQQPEQLAGKTALGGFNNGLGQKAKTKFKDGTEGYVNIPTVNTNIPQPKEYNPLDNPAFKSKTFDEQVSDNFVAHQNKPESIISSAINEYDSYNKWINEINNDLDTSPEVKAELNKWYNDSFGITSDEVSKDIRVPQLVRDYLEKNQTTTEHKYTRYNPSMMGGGSYEVTDTRTENTPEQVSSIKNWLTNTKAGRAVMQNEKQYLEALDKSIDGLELDIRGASDASRLYGIDNKGVSMSKYLRMTKQEKEAYNAERDKIREAGAEQFPTMDRQMAVSQLNELKKLRSAYNQKDASWMANLFGELGRRLPYDITNAASFGAIGLRDSSDLSKVLQDPKNKLARKGYDLVQEYQQAHYLDRTIAQDIAQGTSNTIPFIAQFAATGGITSTLGKGAVGLATKAGVNTARIAEIGTGAGIGSRSLGIGKTLATDIVDAGARSFMMPQTLMGAYERSTTNPDNGFLNDYAHSWFVNTIENYSEKFGTHLPSMGFIKNPKLKSMMERTGIQGFPEEFAEEQLGTALNALFDTGEAEWSDLTDPRNQLVTAGIIALRQMPYASIEAGGYVAGKLRNVRQKRSIRKAYDANLSNLARTFGEETQGIIDDIEKVIVGNESGNDVNNMIAGVMNSEEFSTEQKDAIFKYTLAHLARASMEQSKQEQVEEVQQEASQVVEENTNPQMNAVVSATVAGFDTPMQIVGGNIVQDAEGNLDRKQSDKEIYYLDADGKRKVTSVDFVESVEESIPTEEAIAQASEIASAPIVEELENEEVREYAPGEIVTADVYGNGIPFTGEIVEVTEAGNYIIVGTESGLRSEVQPRQIVNQDNIQGVDNGSLVEYRNEKGQTVQGVVNDAYGLRPQGMIDIDGEVVPVSSIIGLVEEEVDKVNVPNSQETTNIAEQNEQNVTTPPSEQNKVSYLEQVPQDEKGNFKFEESPIETTLGALKEVYSDASDLSGVVDATLANIQKQIEKVNNPKPTGDINKDIANKQGSNQQIAELNNRLSYWQGVQSALVESKPIEERVSEQLMGEEGKEEKQEHINIKNDEKRNADNAERLQESPQRLSKLDGTEQEESDKARSISEQNVSEQTIEESEIHAPATIEEKIEVAEAETDTNPTEAQKEAGNYKKGKVAIQGFDISIEQPIGSTRSGVDETGKEWSITMNNTYGYIRGTEGKDGDHIDVFLGSNPNSNLVFVVDQVNQGKSFDEHKVMFGFDSIEEAREAYLSNYEEGWQGLGSITAVDVETFRKWTDSDTRRIKPFGEYKEIENREDLQDISTPAFGSTNKVITTERYEELKKQMRGKLNNLNMGFDPEVFTIGTQMAMYHIEAGARIFADFASRMIADMGDSVRPYLKSFYEGARHAPTMQKLSKEMDSYENVSKFDIDNFTSQVEEEVKPNNTDYESESDSNKRSDNSSIDDGGVSTRPSSTDVRERTTSTQADGGAKSEQRPAMEGESVVQRGRSDRSTGDNADTSGAKLQTTRTEAGRDSRREDTGDASEASKPLNTNNNRQSRDENVVPRGNVAKINANIAAIKLAKRLFETGKKATPEQMNVLRRYTGWGGLSSVFKENDKNYKALQDLLTHEEYESARASTTTAFYTPPEITSSVWDMIEKLGFKGGNILEPSAGIGNFFALMPEAISNTSNLRGVELDNISGTILKYLYPDAKIDIAGFEKQRIANNSMDLVVSNVPFGNFKVHDSFDKDLSSQFDIHDYFIAKSIRKLKAGGIGVFITTSSTLDKSSSLRNWVINNGNADFIDAVRLNTDTFKNDAGTEATADIIIIRKRDASGRSVFENNMQDSVVAREESYMQQEKNQWGHNTGEVEKKARMTYNKYFLDNPERLAGEMKFGFEGGNAIRPTEQRLAPARSIKQQEVIDKMIADLPSDIYNTTPAEQTSKAIANNGTKEGGLTIIDGEAYIVSYDTAVPVDWNANKAAGYPKAEVLQDYLNIKSALDNLLEAENTDAPDINKLRKQLNTSYDTFVDKYGYLNENRKINFLQDDVDFSSVSAIENMEDGKNGEKEVTKSDIFSKRVIDRQIEPKADNVDDAVRVSINQNGRVDIPYIAELINKTEAEVKKDIIDSRIGFVNPETGLVESRNQYLSGNVRDKLSIAQQANQETEYDSNIEELSKIIPTDIPINLIKMTLGSTWIPTRMYDAFFKETFNVDAGITKTSTDKYIGKLSGKDNAKDIQQGMPRVGGSTLALNSMNNTTTTITMTEYRDGRRVTVTDPIASAQAAAKQTELAETFEAWIKQKKEYTEELENTYNNTFNAVVNSTVDVDSFDRFPGTGGKVVRQQSNLKTPDGGDILQFRVAKENTEADNSSVMELAKKLDLSYDKKTGLFSTDSQEKAGRFEKEANGTAKILRQHQKEGVIRGLEGATLLAHEVGTGKTLTLITTAMEMRRLGLAKKPTIIVQRATYRQFAREIKNQYPNAKVLAPSAKDLTAKQREQLFAKIAYNDWDIVVLYHSYLDSIPDDPQRVAQYIDEKIGEKMDLLDEMERAKAEGGTNAGRMMGALKKEIQKLERDREGVLNPDLEEEGTTKTTRKRSVKDIEKVRSSAEAKAEASLDRRTDNTLTFEQLGIDALLIDEAHYPNKNKIRTSVTNRLKNRHKTMS